MSAEQVAAKVDALELLDDVQELLNKLDPSEKLSAARVAVADAWGTVVEVEAREYETLEPVEDYVSFFFLTTSSSSNRNWEHRTESVGTSQNYEGYITLTTYHIFEEALEAAKDHSTGFWNATIFGRHKDTAQVDVLYRVGDDHRDV
jgi:hypothetical protein